MTEKGLEPQRWHVSAGEAGIQGLKTGLGELWSLGIFRAPMHINRLSRACSVYPPLRNQKSELLIHAAGRYGYGKTLGCDDRNAIIDAGEAAECETWPWI